MIFSNFVNCSAELIYSFFTLSILVLQSHKLLKFEVFYTNVITVLTFSCIKYISFVKSNYHKLFIWDDSWRCVSLHGSFPSLFRVAHFLWCLHTQMQPKSGPNTQEIIQKFYQVPVIIGVLHIHIEWHHTIPSGSLLIG